MTEIRRSERPVQGYLPHNGQELPGRTPPDAISPEVAAKNADEVIRKLMREQKREKSRMQLPELSDPEAEDINPPGKGRAKRKAKADKPTRVRVSGESRAEGTKPARLARMRAELREIRPTRKLVFIGVLGLIMFVRPWLIPVIVFVTFWLVLIAYLTLGPDRVADLVTGAWRRLRMRRPQLAETIRQKADGMALAFDGVLDRLPGKWTESLYMPDFSQPSGKQEEFDAMPDPFDRLANEARQG